MKELDITQTGPMGYKDLQAQNNSQYDDIDNFINESRSRILSAARQSNPYRDAPQLVQSSLSNTNTAWGESLFDNNTANQADFEHLGDVRATNQPWISKLSSGIVKGVGLAGTTFLDGTLGLLYGGIQAIHKGDISQLWDNEISNGLQEFNRSMEEFLPNYRTEAEQTGPWWNNLGTINFWADNFLKNLGFTVGAFYSGGVFTKGISLTGKALQAAGKGLKAANAMNKAAMASTKLGKGVESLGRAMQTSGLGAKLTGSLFSAVNEGRIEANNTTRDLRDLQVQQASDAYEMKKQEILENPFLPKEVKIAKLDALDNNYDATLAQIDDNLKKVGLTDLALNIPILTLSNFWTFGRMYAQGFSNAKNVTTHNVKKSWLGRASQAANEAAEASENVLKNNTLKEAGKFTWNTITKKQAFGRGIVTGITEGNEEMAQALAAEFAGNQQFYTDGPNVYYKAMSNPEALQNTMNSWEALSKAFINTYGNGDRYEEFAVGALTGLLGIPTFGKSQNSSANTWLGRGKSFGISGGIIGEFTSSADMNKKGAAHVENMNALINKREQIDKAARIQSAMAQFTDAMNGFAEADDKFEFQNASDNIDWMGITSFISTGREEDLKTILGQDFDNISDEELEAIAKFTAQRDDSNIGGFREKGSGKLITATSPQSDKDAMKEKLNKAKERMLEEIESYKSSVDLMRNYAAGSPHVTEEKLNELAWMHWKTNRFSSRVNEIKTDNADKFILIAQALEDFKAKQQKILDTKAESTEGLSINALAAAENRNTNLAKSKETARKNLTYVNELLGVINSVASSNKAVMSFLAPMLQMDKGFLTGLLTSNNFYDVAIARGISKPEFDKVIRDIRDLGRLADANKTFNDKLKEYMEDPLKQDKDHEKIDAENEAVGQEINKETARKKAKQVTRKQILDGEADADEVIKNTKTTDIERNLAKDAKVTKQVQTQIETMLAKQQQEGTITNEDARIVEETIAQAIAKSNSINELIDSNAAFMVDAHGQPLSDAQLVLIQNLMETAVKAVAEAEDLNITDGKIDFNKVEEAVEAHINGPSKESVDAIEKVANVPTAGNDAVEKAVAVNRGTNTNTAEQAPKKSKNPNQKQKQRDEKVATRAAKEKKRLEAQAAKKNKIIATALVYASHSNDLNLSTQEGQKGAQLISDMLSKAYDLLQQGKITKLSDIISVLKSMDEYEKFQQLFGIDPVLGAALTSLSENMHINFTEDNESDGTAELDSIIGPETINDATADPTEYSSQNLNPAINIPNYFAPATSQFYKDPKTGRISPEPFTKKVTIGNKARKKKLKATYNYLAEKQAFKNASQVKVGQDIYFTIHPNLNTAAGGIVILMSTDKEGKHIVGDLADTESATYQNNLLLKAMVDRITKEFNDRADKTSSEPFVSKETSTVRQTMVGHVLFSNSTKAAEDLFLNKVFGDGGFKMGVVNRAGDVITTNQGNENVSGELNVIKPNTRFKPGTPVVLIPSGEGTNVYIAVPFQMDKYTSAMKGSKFHKYAETILKRVLLNSNGEALDFRDQKPQILVKNALNSLFNGSFHVNFRKGQLVIHRDLQTVKDGVVEKKKDVLFTGSPNSNLVTDILQALQDKEMTIRIDRREINKNSNLKDLDFTYNTIIGDLAHTNLLPQSATTVNDWFIINPLNEEGEEININRVPYHDSRVDIHPKQRNDTIVTYNNNEYIVSDEDVIIDKDGNPRTDINVSDQQIILAKAEISKNEFATPIGFEGDQIFWYSLSNGSLFYNKAGKEKIVASEIEKQEIINNLTTNKNSSESTDKRYPKEFYSQAQKDFFDAMPQERQKLLLQANPNAITAVLPYIDSIMKNFGLEDLEEIEDDINNIFDLLTSNKYRRVSEKDGYTPIDLNTEIAWLKKALPQLSDNDHLRIVTGLIKISQQSNPGYAYGKTQKGIMTVSSAAATGTVYHEAFHSVIDTLLTDEEISDLFIAGAKKYSIERDSINNELAIEENLAEDFRRYVQREQAYKEDVQQSSGISKIFKILKHTIKIWLENTSYINNMFYRINKGNLANRAVVNNRNTERFNQYTDEEKHILDRAPRDSQGRLLAPNGKPSNLTEKQYAQVRTEAFKEWFGDWENDPDNASKVVDENGEPLVVYHGSTRQFNTFKTDKIGSMSGDKSGFYFTNKRQIAKDYYSKETGTFLGNLKLFLHISNEYKSSVYDTFLNSRNPYVVTLSNDSEYWNREQIINDAKEKGYDSVLFKDVIDGPTVRQDVRIVFNSNQIKSATDNIGTFDANNPDIRYRKANITSEDIQRYHKEAVDYLNLDSSKKDLLEDRGITEDEYEFLTHSERENLMMCLI